MTELLFSTVLHSKLKNVLQTIFQALFQQISRLKKPFKQALLSLIIWVHVWPQWYYLRQTTVQSAMAMWIYKLVTAAETLSLFCKERDTELMILLNDASWHRVFCTDPLCWWRNSFDGRFGLKRHGSLFHQNCHRSLGWKQSYLPTPLIRLLKVKKKRQKNAARKDIWK